MRPAHPATPPPPFKARTGDDFPFSHAPMLTSLKDTLATTWETLAAHWPWPDLGRNLLSAAIVLGTGLWGTRIVLRFAKRAFARAHLDVTLAKFLHRVAHGFLLVVVALAVLNILGVETTSLVAAIGATGLAIGLALQGTLSNFAAGMMLVVFRPFNVDDAIEAGGITGTVEEIGLFTTTLRTPDNRLVVVPNSTFTSNAVTNTTAKPTRRLDLSIGISYGDNLATARDIIRRVLAEDARVLTSPPPSILLSNLGESAVDIAIRPWVKTPDYWAARSDLLEKLKAALENGGCTIPYPQRDIHLFHEKPTAPAPNQPPPQAQT
ncbi:MAG: mechanosensitive ion channel family protein [Puniceicoccales bacterium]|jgi:small conductance mechanosensitive channel|nr:mechanosensitive ion channel family protein [Puniceicoccales bacterium]